MTWNSYGLVYRVTHTGTFTLHFTYHVFTFGLPIFALVFAFFTPKHLVPYFLIISRLCAQLRVGSSCALSHHVCITIDGVYLRLRGKDMIW